eukprot:3633741-Alexandrium_andersonii.AAC.1
MLNLGGAAMLRERNAPRLEPLTQECSGPGSDSEIQKFRSTAAEAQQVSAPARACGCARVLRACVCACVRVR